MKYSSTCCEERSAQILLRDSTACHDGQKPESGRAVAIETHLVPDDGLLDGSEVLQGREQDVTPLRATDILDKVAELLAQRNQDLILVLDRLCIGVRGSV